MGRDSGKTRFYVSDWQKHRLRQYALAFGKFAATVLCSALLAVWIDRHFATIKRHASALTGMARPARRPVATRQPFLASASPARGVRSLGDHYSRYFEEALPLLRAEKSVRMVKIEMTSAILGYQESSATRAEGAGFRLQSQASRIPLIAVSRSAKDFLTTMRITFIDPKSVPIDVLKAATPVAGEALGNFLLVPDVSGDGAAKFVFSRR